MQLSPFVCLLKQQMIFLFLNPSVNIELTYTDNVRQGVAVQKIFHAFLCVKLKYAHDVAGVSMNSLAAQAFVFFIAGFETSSSTMTFCLYELSLHQDIQDRVREEIDVVLQKHDSKLTYEGILEMEYLDKVVSGKAQFLKKVSNTRINLLNNLMSLAYVSLLHINLQ